MTLGWVLFRAGSLDVVAGVFGALHAYRPLAGTFPLVPLALVTVGLLTHTLALRHDLAGLWLRLPRVAQGVGYGIAIVLVGLFSAQTTRFIYFQF